MKNFEKRIAISIVFALLICGCQKETDLALEKDRLSSFDAQKTSEIQLNKTPFAPIPKSTSFDEKQEFIDGGFVQVAGQFFPTKIVGDQRWITANYTTPVTGQTFNNGGTIHHSYEAAMALDGSPTQINIYAPSSLVETSNWRIPSWQDMNHLYIMTYGDNEGIATGLNLTATGMVKWDRASALETAVHVNPALCIFWNSDFIEATTSNYGTWHLTAHNTIDYMYLFQYQIPYPYAPIRLVQDVEPIQQ